MQVQFNQWQSINLQDFSNSFGDITDSVKDTDNTLTSLASQSIYFYDGSNSTGYGSWGSYDISVKGSNFLGSSPRATYVKLTDSGEKYEFNGSINISNTVWGYVINGGTFSSLTHSDAAVTDYIIKGSFTYSPTFNNSINGGTITSATVNPSSGKLTLTGTLNIDSNEVITSGTISSISYTSPDGKSFSISNALIDAADLQSILQGAGSSTDFSTLSSFLLSSSYLTGNDTIIGDSQNNTLDGGAGVDKLIGGAGDDTYIVDLVRTGTTPANFKVALQDTITEATNAGSDTVQLRLLSGTDFSTMANATTLTLGANLENLNASDTGSTKLNLTGNALANTLTGNDANNILDGGAGVDTLIGGLGDDTYMLDLKVSAGNIVFDDSITELDGNNEGIDTIKLRGTATLATAATLTLDNDWANIEILDASATGSTKLNLTGNNLGNTLIGNAAANILTGGTGDDTLNGGAGIDTMIGGAGNDTYIVDNIADIVTEDSNEGTDLVKASVSYTLGANIEDLELTGAAAINGTGNGLDNVITGNAGNNVLDGGAGADSMEGGKGNDTYIVDDEDDEVIEAANGGTDLVKASVDYELTDFVENLTLTGNDHINGTGNALANTITGNAGNNILDGGDGVDKLIGGAGDDIYIVDLIQTGTNAAAYRVALQDTITEAANAGNDTVKLRGNFDHINATTLTLGANLENLDASATGLTKLNLTGNALANTLTGNDADNILDGGAGVDTLQGGEGNDTYILDLKATAGILSIEDAVEEFNGTTDGIDTIKLRGSATLATAATLTLDNDWANIEILDASATGSTKLNLTGNNLGNTLIGNAAANILTGGTGDDTLNGGAGIDTMIGGAGNDTYIVDNIADIVTEDSNEGTDLVKASVSYTLGANIEDLELTGAAAINGTGNDDANIITGNAGNNILDGKGGIDSLRGGKGNDTYIVDDEDDEVIEAANEGTDLVKASVDYELTDFVENLTLTGNDHINGTGNALANIITGNAGNNILDGGAGVDKLIGGNGDDTYIVDLVRTGTTPANFKVALQDTITETANAGSDTVQLRLLSGTDYSTMANATTLTLGANLERFDASGTESIKLNLTGNALANTLTGNDADNILDGGAGVDTLQGGEGNDTYILDLKATAGILSIEDTVEEFNGTTDGIDTIKLRGTAPLSTAATLTLDNDWANVEILDASATGSTKLNLTGNNLGNTLIGNAAVNILTGGTGDDTLNGGAGADSMIGGDGDDTYIVDNIADIVTEDLNEGTDLVKASVSYTLGANIENLELTGTAAINGTGNGLDNVITGNAGNNILDGGAGADTLIGGKGNDTYIVDDEDDEVIEAANEGIDLVKASVSYTLSDNVENLTLTDGSANGGTAALNGTGNALANTITGNAGNNILDGGAGVDKLIGGNGDDTYIVDLVRTGTAPANYKVALQDTITETAVAGSGTDTVILRGSFTEPTTFTTLTIGANLENLDASFTGSTKLNLTGNALNNTLMGNDANNILDGGAGNDILIGGKGSDTLKGGLGADVFKWGADDLGPAGNISNSTDTITDFSVTQGDQLDLRDLLVGETEGNIFDYISVEAAGSSTVLHISTTGQFTGGSYNAGEEDTRIILSNTNLLMATGQSTYELAIQHMITNQSLLID